MSFERNRLVPRQFNITADFILPKGNIAIRRIITSLLDDNKEETPSIVLDWYFEILNAAEDKIAKFSVFDSYKAHEAPTITQDEMKNVLVESKSRVYSYLLREAKARNIELTESDFLEDELNEKITELETLLQHNTTSL